MEFFFVVDNEFWHVCLRYAGGRIDVNIFTSHLYWFVFPIIPGNTAFAFDIGVFIFFVGGNIF